MCWPGRARAYEQLLERVQALSEEQVGALYGITPEGRLRPAREPDTSERWSLWSIIDGNAGQHYFDHIPGLRAWLEGRQV